MRFMKSKDPLGSALAKIVLIVLTVIGPASVSAFSQGSYFPPSNDNFRDAEPIANERGSAQGDLLGATVEPNEVLIGKGMATVWYKWTAPADLSMTFRIRSEDGPIVGIGVFIGDHVGKLNLLASGDARDRITMMVNAGQEYKIQASAKTSEHLDTFYLTWNINAAESWKQFNFDGHENALGEPERGHSDFAVLRRWTKTPTWWIWSERGGSAEVYSFGNVQTTMNYVSGDYDGDEKADIAVFYPGTGMFWIFQSSDKVFRVEQWGSVFDFPIAGDFDGDDISDIAIWRRGDATFWIKRSSDETIMVEQWGIAFDNPIAADYDGDGATDIAVVRNFDGGQKRFFIRRSSDKMVMIQDFGLAGDVVIPGDFDADGKADIAVFRRDSDSTFHYLRSSDGKYVTVGLPWEDSPYYYVAAGDYYNGPVSDLCAWTYGSTAALYCLPDGGEGSLVKFPFGLPGDVPIAATWFDY